MNSTSVSRHPLSRRQFVRHTAIALGSVALAGPLIRSVRAGEPGPNSKIRLALIGSGQMGRGDLECFLGFPEVECVAIADVDEAQIAEGLKVCEKAGRPRPDTVRDFRRVLDRKDVDAVLIATPDHWHALPAVMACQAGKDVYLEKPLAKTIDEGRAIVTATQKHGRVLQMGSQWRSCKHMLAAAEFVKSGKLGKITMARGWANLDWQPKVEKKPDGTPPATADYDFWLGPAAKRPFNPNHFHFNFRWYWDYAGGLMTDWGVHLLNMISLGVPFDGLKSVSSTGTKHPLGDDWETPGAQTALYEFPDFMLVWEHLAGYGTTINNHPWGVAWYGSDGIIMMNDAGWEIIQERRNANLDPAKFKGSGNPRPAHVRNFLDCLSSRKQPSLHAELGHQISTVAHLGNIACRTHSTVQWDAAREKIIHNPDADKLVSVKYRAPWNLPYSRRA
jgi:predicted dehydrogenase